MAYFARKLRYGAHDGEEGVSYIALIELAKKKGGKPAGFVLYYRRLQHGHPAIKMIRLKAATAEEAIRRFWPYEEDGGEEFPGWRSSRWEQTTFWLNTVAVGGWFERFGYKSKNGAVRFGAWVKVGTPPLWRKRRQKKPIQFGNLARLILTLRGRLRRLEDEKMRLDWSLFDFDADDEGSDCPCDKERNRVIRSVLRRQIAEIEREIDAIGANITNKRAEMHRKLRRRVSMSAGKTPKQAIGQMVAAESLSLSE